MQAAKGKEALLIWCQKSTEGYKNVDVKNFHTSWKDGLAFCAIIHKHEPVWIDFDSLDPKNAAHNLGLAFDVIILRIDEKVAEQIGICPLLDVEDMLIEKPEPLSVLTYLSTFYLHFTKKPSTPLPGTFNLKFNLKSKSTRVPNAVRTWKGPRRKPWERCFTPNVLPAQNAETNYFPNVFWSTIYLIARLVRGRPASESVKFR